MSHITIVAMDFEDKTFQAYLRKHHIRATYAGTSYRDAYGDDNPRARSRSFVHG
jgi:hypothetical protein